MNQYLFLLHEKPADAAAVSPAEMKEIVGRYKVWSADLAQRGLLTGGEKLCDDGGRHLRLKDGRPLATDGPYAEAHDVIGGIFMVKAENDTMAEELAQTCPHLQGTQWIEIRRIEVM
ncbi:MAG: YciI family protein [Rubrivivax sp.]|nr:YciI family protein [Rubrivivax sp.]MDP3222491.1 YciI family protein [Rubrivivax sp.]MDP3613167.1 YciI family protein [Rubrivivax sp.]